MSFEDHTYTRNARPVPLTETNVPALEACLEVEDFINICKLFGATTEASHHSSGIVQWHIYLKGIGCIVYGDESKVWWRQKIADLFTQALT